MNPITIPRNLTQDDDLIIIPRQQYESLLSVFKKQPKLSLKGDLDQALTEVNQGKAIGAFNSGKQLVKSLEV